MHSALYTNLARSGERERGFITSSGAPVKNGKWIANLLQAIILLYQIAVVKCNAHTDGFDEVSWGNARADTAAKAAAISPDAPLVWQCTFTPAATPSLGDINTL